jgi:transposase
VRTQEVRKLQAEGEEPILKKSRWIFLKRPKNLSEKQDQKLADLLKQNLKTIKSYLLKEDFQRLREYVHPAWAGKFIDLNHSLILNCFKAKKTNLCHNC